MREDRAAGPRLDGGCRFERPSLAVGQLGTARDLDDTCAVLRPLDGRAALVVGVDASGDVGFEAGRELLG